MTKFVIKRLYQMQPGDIVAWNWSNILTTQYEKLDIRLLIAIIRFKEFDIDRAKIYLSDCEWRDFRIDDQFYVLE